MHILDLIMYFVIAGLLWLAMDLFSKGEFTREMGALIGWFVLFIFTIIYIILFALYPDWNWIDIFKGDYSFPITITW